MRCQLSAWSMVLPVLMGLLVTAPLHTTEVPSAVPISNMIHLRAQYGLTPDAEKMLRQNGFLVLDQVRFRTLGDAYPRQHHTTPMYITTDVMLELWSSLNRELLKSTERQVCIQQLTTLLPALERSAKTLSENANEAQSRKALRQIQVTIAVASRLLAATDHFPAYPSELRPEIDSEVQKVMAHHEASPYPGEDYTQYTVRGHYAEDAALSRYFRASMWLSRHLFAVPPEPSSDTDAGLRAGVAFASVVRAADPAARAALVDLLKMREALTGPPDAVSLPQLISALDRSVGRDWRLDQALLPPSLAALRKELARPLYPVSQVRTRIVMPGAVPFPTQAVAMLPGIAVPDSVLFQQTVHPAIENRSLPTGLEVAASLGSEAARLEIQQREGVRSNAVLAAADRNSMALKADDGATVYSGWLHALSTLSTPPKGGPDFMRTPAWRVEKLNTMLASWAQLRHNFLLYSNQNYSMTLSKQMEEPALVEANPAFYHAMAQLAGRTLKVLQAAGSQDLKHAKALADYAAKCREFEKYAQAELAGTLTHSQSEEIDKFCDWLDRSATGSASAMVADVATGMQGETLHAATGDLCTLLVIPDRKTGAVYTGAVSSYYEFTRPGLTRLTDAEWQAQQVQTYLRPERPSWAFAFMAHEGGTEWESRAPLRAAEKLLVDSRTEEALALLRATVGKSADSALATEAQFRLGRYYFDRHEWAQAQAELRRCERLPGCDAFDQAQNLSREVQGEQQRLEYLQKVAAPARAKGLAELKSLQDAVEAQKRTPADAGKEQIFAKRLLSVLPWEEGSGAWQMESKALLRVAWGAFRTQPCQDAIGYALLFLEHGGRYHVGSRAESDLELAFSHRVVSPPLRAAALSLALQDGYLANQPQAALALLQPFLDAHLLTNDSDPALQLVLTPPGKTLGSDDAYGLDLRTDPRNLLHTQIAKPLRTLATAAIEAGQIRQAVRYARLYPAGSFGANNGEDIEFANIIEEWGSISDADLPAASLLAILEGQETKKQTEAMAPQALTLATRYPHSRYTLIALCKAINSSREENSPQVRKLKAILAQNFPNSIPALCIAIETAFDEGDLTQARRLLSNYQARTRGHESEPSSEQDPLNVRYVEYRLSDYDGKVQQLKPLLDAANTPEAMRMDQIESNGEPLADVLIKRLPHRTAEIYLTLGQVYHNSALTMRFLERFPSDPRAGEAWKLLSGEDNRSTPGALNYGGPETVVWLAPFVNRHDGHSAAAAQLLQKVMGNNSVQLAEEEARIVQGRYPQSQASNVADLAAAQVLLTNRRPEAMLAYADRAISGTERNDPLHREAVQLRQQGAQEIAAKHR